MVYNFIDTSAILNGAVEQFKNCWISAVSLIELENIKDKREKDENIKMRARQALRAFLINTELQIISYTEKDIKKLLKKYNHLLNINDHYILCEAELFGLEKTCQIYFYTSDMAQYHFALTLPHIIPIFYQQKTEQEEYKGWRKIYPTDMELAVLYAHPEQNIFNLKCNEFAKIIVDNKIVDLGMWNGEKYRPLNFKEIRNGYTGDVIRPLNIEQKMAFDLLQNPAIKVKLLTSAWGSGKTMIALNYALEQVYHGRYKRLIFIRNNIIVADTNDIGFLPGDVSQKMTIWGGPIADHLGGQEMLENLINEGTIEIYPISHIRGRSIKDSIVLCDECENLNDKLVTLLLSRIEESSEIIFCGDVAQIDNKKFEHNNGIQSMLQNLAGNPLFGTVKLIKSERGAVARMCDLMIPPK